MSMFYDYKLLKCGVYAFFPLRFSTAEPLEAQQPETQVPFRQTLFKS